MVGQVAATSASSFAGFADASDQLVSFEKGEKLRHILGDPGFWRDRKSSLKQLGQLPGRLRLDQCIPYRRCHAIEVMNRAKAARGEEDFAVDLAGVDARGMPEALNRDALRRGSFGHGAPLPNCARRAAVAPFSLL